MTRDLNALKTEIESHLEANGLVVFHGCSRAMDDIHTIHWDVDRHPDYGPFVKAARDAGVKMIVFHHREFGVGYVDDALERLEESDMPAEERRPLEHRLRDLRMYAGFTCALELSFDYQERVYLFELRTEWYLEFLDTLEEIDVYFPGDDDEDEEGPIGGYYSRN